MRTDIDYRPSYALLTAWLDPGESIRAEPGAMVAQQGVEMATGMSGSGGLLGGLRRAAGGESFFVNTFTGGPSGGFVALVPPAPGDISQMRLLPGQDILLQGSSYLASTPGLDVDASFQGIRGLFSGEGMFFLRVSADRESGEVFFNSYGAIREIEVAPGTELVVDTGHLVAFTPGVDYRVGKVGGIRSLLGGGEGLVMRLNGQGTVWVQTRSLESLADRLRPHLPSGR